MTKGEGRGERGGPGAPGGVDHLFRRDLRQGGWFVEHDQPFGRPKRPEPAGDRAERKPDPAVIWALRRKK